MRFLKTTDPVNYAPYIGCPVLFLHTRGDTNIPLSYCANLYRAVSARKEIEIIEDSYHGYSGSMWLPLIDFMERECK